MIIYDASIVKSGVTSENEQALFLSVPAIYDFVEKNRKFAWILGRRWGFLENLGNLWEKAENGG